MEDRRIHRKNPFCQSLLKQNFKGIPVYGDIKKYKGRRGEADIITGGFPCQPFSIAGKRDGEDDNRFLWPEMFRLIREIQPVAVIGENVTGIETLEDGKTFERVCSDLEGEGYTVQPFIIPACAVEAWHRRNRVWFLAYANDRTSWANGREAGKKISVSGVDRTEGRSRKFARTNSSLCPIPGLNGFTLREETIFALVEGKPDLSTPATCRNYDGIPFGMDRIKALGNAIVPQIAVELLLALDEMIKS